MAGWTKVRPGMAGAAGAAGAAAGAAGAATIVVVLAFCASGCSKKEGGDEARLAPTASALEPSKAAMSATMARYVIDPSGVATFDMPAPKEHIKGRATGAAGALEVDPANLAATRGEVRVDLTTLSTGTFDDGEKNSSQTKHARGWLEVAEPADEAARAANRYIAFAIRSVDVDGPTDAAKIPTTIGDGGAAVRSVSVTAHGEILLHGHKVNKDAKLEVRLVGGPGAATGAADGSAASTPPSRIEIRTREPLVVTLAEHDVKPRDSFGKIAKSSFGLIGTKVAETAAVTLDLSAALAR